MQKHYPFKFLDAYTREDRDFFFGREEEIELLYQMVFQTDLILVYGASGTGKSSLIQCGLAGKFQSHDWLALNIKRGQNLNESFDKAIQEAGGELTPGDNFDWLHEDLSVEGETKEENLSPLERQFKSVYLRHFKPIYLIFDQFEELYILGTKEEQSQFVKTVQEVLRVKQPVKIIISIREEYLGHLYEFERAVPELLRKKLRIEPMNLDKVKSVIKNIGNRADSLVKLQAGQEDTIAEGIFEKIHGSEKTLHIPLPYLQVFMDKLYLQITGDHQRQSEAMFSLASLAEIGDIGDVLRNFLDDQVGTIASEYGQTEEQVWKQLSQFVTLDGTKEPLSEAQFAHKLPHTPPERLRLALQAFVSHRILRFSEASQLYEIAHDSLAKQIHAKRSDEEIALLEVQRLVKSQTALKAEAREYFSEKQLLFIEPYLSKYNLSEEEAAWIAASRDEIEAKRAKVALRERAELERVRTQAEADKRRAEEAERLQKQAETEKKRTQKMMFYAIGLAGLACIASLGAGYMYDQAESAKNKAIKAEMDANISLDSYKIEEQKRRDAEAANKYTEFEKEIILANGQLSGGGSCLSDSTYARLQRAVYELKSPEVVQKVQMLNIAIEKNQEKGSTNLNCPLIKIQ